ncbi:TlpA family protein disulfide reductase [Flavivirga jejuensis]|uniref:TlpA disulfide reductase family protein n=1 Tax=Flavivirga jejuensis TaxID=870487 RepID=A0ABT8WJE5_9FLAO|nr:TlpA disulfide reductase family protein [Flavivirga jejuensis]MDO5973119.1 TlpA disulfide reductase family protein [Flavivirga jejuensis]
MNKILLTSIILFFVITISGAQVKTYYKTSNSNRIFTKNKYDKHKEDIMSQLNDKYDEVTINERLIDSLTSQDSIIKTYKLEIRTKKTSSKGIKRPKEKIYNYLNKELPNFNLQTINGENISFSDLKNKPTVINFWFTRCKPCVEEMPILNKLVEKYSDKVNFISITPESKKAVTLFLEKHKFNYVHLVSARNYINEIGLYSYPKNVFINKLGEIKHIKYGIPTFKKNGVTKLGTGDEFERFIKELL